MVKIRLARYGRHHSPFYRVVAVDSRVKRDGGYKELLGTYDPLKGIVSLNEEGIKKWLGFGAQPTKTVKSLLQKKKIWSELSKK